MQANTDVLQINTRKKVAHSKMLMNAKFNLYHVTNVGLYQLFSTSALQSSASVAKRRTVNAWTTSMSVTVCCDTWPANASTYPATIEEAIMTLIACM